MTHHGMRSPGWTNRHASVRRNARLPSTALPEPAAKHDDESRQPPQTPHQSTGPSRPFSTWPRPRRVPTHDESDRAPPEHTNDPTSPHLSVSKATFSSPIPLITASNIARIRATMTRREDCPIVSHASLIHAWARSRFLAYSIVGILILKDLASAQTSVAHRPVRAEP